MISSCDDGFIVVENKCFRLKTLGQICNPNFDYCKNQYSSCIYHICMCTDDFFNFNMSCVPFHQAFRPQKALRKSENNNMWTVILPSITIIIIAIIMIILFIKYKFCISQEYNIDLERAFYNNIWPSVL